MKNSESHVHIIGISGVGTSAIAVALNNAGYKVTGSDKGIYPPVSTYLDEAQIKYYVGWHPEKMIENGVPDIIISGGSGTSETNPEIMKAKELGKEVISYAEAVGKMLAKKRSIVCVGTWGKTTSSALLSFVMIKANLNPSYFFGGLSLSHQSGSLTDSDWSIFEGDEYQSSITDKQAKFFHYKPTDLLMTSISWDHADLYPTESEYVDCYRKLLKKIPNQGKIVSCLDNQMLETLLIEENKKHVTYGKDSRADYRYENIIHSKDGLTLDIVYKAKKYKIKSSMIGSYNSENIAGVFAMANEIGINPEIIIGSIAQFKGIKRRFERRLSGDITILDCLAPTAEKASSVLASAREIFHNKIIAVYEPNIGGRQKSSISMYKDAFKNADEVIIPRLTKLKVDSKQSAEEKALEGDELAHYISETHKKAYYIDNDDTLVEHLKNVTKKDDVIIFLGSHGFRGMIENAVRKFSQ
jgi:UDP-N-acetylmuramate: L-alanyl-gamma-D-glutamyl-meso-diaminopimelate ligase